MLSCSLSSALLAVTLCNRDLQNATLIRSQKKEKEMYIRKLDLYVLLVVAGCLLWKNHSVEKMGEA